MPVYLNDQSIPHASHLSAIPTIADAEHFLLLLPSHILLEPGAHPLIVSAYIFAAESHDGQHRKSGEPYFMHPVAVAQILTQLAPDVDAAMICAALLHDTIEDCGITKEEISARTTPEVAQLVDGLTKVDDPETRLTHEEHTFRKLRDIAMKDPRVYLIKFADILHNIETLNQLPVKRKENYLNRVLTKYIPLARELHREDIAVLLEKKVRTY